MWLIWFLSHFLFSYWGLFLILIVVGPYIAEKVRFAQRRNAFLQHQKSNLINPDDSDARFQLAQLYLDGGRWKRAEQYFRQAIEIYQRHGETAFDKLYLGLAQCCYNEGKYEEAIGNALDAVKVSERGTYGEAPLLLALSYSKRGQKEKAREWALKAAKENGTLSQAFYLSGILSEKEEARKHFDRAVEAYKASPPFMRSKNRTWALRSSLRRWL
jgi:tetratricopeptide (TPR) repeat protein